MDRWRDFSFPVQRRGRFRTDDFIRDLDVDFDSTADSVMNYFNRSSRMPDEDASYRSTLADRSRHLPRMTVDDDDDFFSRRPRRRGNFRTDDFFRGFQTDFDSAISGVMDRFGGRSLLADQFTNYRSLRDRMRKSPSSTDSSNQFKIDNGDAGTAASISETPDNYMIVLDMSDYVQGSISVETRGLYAVIEAKIGNSSFKRKYPLPRGTNTERVVAALSDEGILTITAQKKGPTSAGPPTPADRSFSPLKIDVGQPDRDSKTSENLVRLIMEGDDDNASQSTATTGDDISTPASPEPMSPPADQKRVLPISKKGKFFQDGYFENVWQDFEKAMDEMVEKERKKETKAVPREELASKLQDELLIEAQKKQMQLDKEEQQRREQQMQQQQEEKRQEQMLQEQRRSSGHLEEIMRPQFTRLNSYRNLRRWAPEDSQAATLSKDENGYKIVMDVKEFAEDGNLSIKGTDNGLNVTGSKGGLTFERSFTLPGLKDPELVNATMSEDGVLTITAPTNTS